MGKSNKMVELSALERGNADLEELEAGLRKPASGQEQERWTEELEASSKKGKQRWTEELQASSKKGKRWTDELQASSKKGKIRPNRPA